MDHQDIPQPRVIDTKNFLVLSTFTYLIMSLIAVNIIRYSDLIELSRVFQKPEGLTGSLQVISAVLSIIILLLFSSQLERLSPSYRDFKQTLRDQFGKIKPAYLVYLAALSGFSEELLFRGAIQPFLGIGATSIIFGLLHLGPGGKITAWTGWATFSGVLFGSITVATSSIWLAVVIHSLVNLISMLLLRKDYCSKSLKRSNS